VRVEEGFQEENMPCKALIVGTFAFFMALSTSHALTVEEVLALKRAGVGDETIQMLLEQEDKTNFPAERLGSTVTDDGRVIRSTGRTSRYSGFSETYTGTEVFVYPSARFRPLRRR
jgi:hypothetical protein